MLEMQYFNYKFSQWCPPYGALGHVSSTFNNFIFSSLWSKSGNQLMQIPGCEVCRECPMTYFPAFPLGTNPGDATE